MSQLNSPQYAYDPTGRLPENLITGELQALTGGTGRDYYFIVPVVTPFFEESLQIAFKDLQGGIRTLVEGIDYYCTHFFLGATRASGKSVYGSITILNNALRGTATLQYQTLGGEWTMSAAEIAAILANQLYNPREITWEQVSGKPNIFPAINHEWNLQDMVGMKDVNDTLNRLIDAILTAASNAMTTHINDVLDNPHQVTAAMIGAVTKLELKSAIDVAINDAAIDTDKIREGATNTFFTADRVLKTLLAGYAVGAPSALSEQDTVLAAFTKLQAQLTEVKALVAKSATLDRPQFTGLGSQNLVALELSVSPLNIDISKANAFQIAVKASGSIGFDLASVGNMTGKVIEFSVTTINVAAGFAISWPANVKWVDGTPPPRSTAINAKDYWYFVSEDNMVSFTGSLSNANPR